MADVSALHVFTAVVEHGSYAEAARHLDITPSYVSRIITRLEEDLGVRLLHRTTRRVSLTDTGSSYYEQIRPALGMLDDARRAVRNTVAQPIGRLRMSLPQSLGAQVLAPLVVEVAEQYPRLELELSLSDRQVDVVGEGYDLVVRVADLRDTSLIARRLCSTRAYTLASPSFLARFGTPRHPMDLLGLDCLLFDHQVGGPRRWVFQRGDEAHALSVHGRFRADSGDAMLHAAIGGLGVVRAPDFLANPAIANGSLIRILPDWETETGVWALFPHSRHLDPKVRVMVDHLAEKLRFPPWTLTPATPPEAEGR